MRYQKPLSRIDSNQDPSLKPCLRTLTIETEDCNIIARLLQAELILVLVGKIPPSKRQTFRIVSEADGDPRYPDIEGLGSRPGSSYKPPLGDPVAVLAAANSSQIESLKPKAASIRSNMSQREKDIRIGTLHVQRKRLDALANYILKDFEETGFVMPADSDLQ